MIPLTLLTGFLGSGKTTLLARLAQQHRAERVVYLVNEFAPVDIDGQRLDVAPDALMSVAGGSIFCQCKVQHFQVCMERIIARQQHPDTACQAVAIEASGMANPRVIEQLLRDTGLAAHFELLQVITVVDPASFHKLQRTLPNIVDQIETADVAVVNKIDLSAPERVAQTLQAVRAINPHCRIVETVQAVAPLSLLHAAPRPLRQLNGALTHCADNQYTQIATPAHGLIDLPRLHGALRELGDGLYRVKGYVKTVAGYAYLDGDVHDVHWRIEPPRRKAHLETFLVLIGAPERSSALRDLARAIRLGEFALPGSVPVNNHNIGSAS